MTEAKLPKNFDPYKICRSAPPEGRQIQGECRLRTPFNHPVIFELNFSLDSDGYPLIMGRVLTVVVLQCQRCLENMDYELIGEVRVRPVESDAAAKALPEGLEPLITVDQQADLRDWLTEELNLAMPIAPRHDVCPSVSSIN